MNRSSLRHPTLLIHGDPLQRPGNRSSTSSLTSSSVFSRNFSPTNLEVDRSRSSNILIGFLTYLRRHPHHLISTKARWMSHAALTLILERGRAVTRRVLVASSPLYQPVEPATQLGYEVQVYARVPD